MATRFHPFVSLHLWNPLQVSSLIPPKIFDVTRRTELCSFTNASSWFANELSCCAVWTGVSCHGFQNDVSDQVRSPEDLCVSMAAFVRNFLLLLYCQKCFWIPYFLRENLLGKQKIVFEVKLLIWGVTLQNRPFI